MAFNVRSGGNAASVPVPSTVESGDVVVVGNLVGIAEIDATAGDDGLYYTTLALEGIAHAPVSGADVGDIVYADDAGPGTVALTLAAGDGPAVGIVTNAESDRAFFKIVQTAVAVAP